MISEAERDQRLRDLNRQLREINSRRAAIAEQWHGNPPLDISNELAALDEETTSLRAERAELQEPGALDTWARLNAMWKLVSDLDLDTRERWKVEEQKRLARQTQIDLWFGLLTVWLLVLSAGLYWFSSQVWRITELWR